MNGIIGEIKQHIKKENEMTNARKPTTFGTKVAMLMIGVIFLFICLHDWDSSDQSFSQQVDINGIVTIEQLPVQQATTAEPVFAKQIAAKPVVKQSKWVEPRIYPGVKLYYSHDGTRMQYVGTIFDAVSRTINGKRCFGIRYANGNEEYKYREILWNGQWYMDRVQGQKMRDELYGQ